MTVRPIRQIGPISLFRPILWYGGQANYCSLMNELHSRLLAGTAGRPLRKPYRFTDPDKYYLCVDRTPAAFRTLTTSG
jgi:hypothetical protein